MGILEERNVNRSKRMSKYLVKPFLITALGLSAGVLIPSIAHSQAKPVKTLGGTVLPDPNAINKKIQQNYPPELLDEDPRQAPTQQAGSTTGTPINVPGGNTTSGSLLKSGDDNTTTLGTANYTFVMSTPIMIAIAVIIGGLALFPVVSILLNSKKAAKLGKESLLSKFGDRFRKPQVLESDKWRC